MNILITGGGGTGKSTSLKAIVKYLKRKNKQIRYSGFAFAKRGITKRRVGEN